MAQEQTDPKYGYTLKLNYQAHAKDVAFTVATVLKISPLSIDTLALQGEGQLLPAMIVYPSDIGPNIEDAKQGVGIWYNGKPPKTGEEVLLGTSNEFAFIGDRLTPEVMAEVQRELRGELAPL